MKTTNLMRPVRRHFRGLGDVVHVIAYPVAVVSDAVLKTDLKNCPACAAERQRLNQKHPFKP